MTRDDLSPQSPYDCILALATRLGDLEVKVDEYARMADLRAALEHMTEDRNRWRELARNAGATR